MAEDRVPEKRRTVGVISDTHGLFRPEVEKTFEGVDMIVHAGDVGSPEVLGLLKAIAPVAAVRGNMDKGEWTWELQDTGVVEAGEALLYVLHDINRLDIDPAAAGFGAVIFGHSHRPSVLRENGVLFLNPGSAGPRRFIRPVSVALLSIGENSLHARIVELDV